MKFQNLLGMFSVLLIALSGPSYASGYGSPPYSPPASPSAPTPTFTPTIPFTPPAVGTDNQLGVEQIDCAETTNTAKVDENRDRRIKSNTRIFGDKIEDGAAANPRAEQHCDIAPTVLEPEGTESNCGGSVESCKKEGEDRGSSLAKRVIKKIVEKEILDAKDKGKTIADLPKILEYYEKDGSGELLFQILLTLVHPVGGGVGLTKPEKVLTKLAAQRAEFSLRTIIKRLLKSARNPNCDDNCKAYNESKIKAVDTFHESFVEALYHADIPLLQS